jgi:hypothetical protein
MTTPRVPEVSEISEDGNKSEKRPSWRLKVDTGSKVWGFDALDV